MSTGPQEPRPDFFEAGGAPVDQTVDPAQQSLTDALRLGFTLLGVIMVVLVALYLASGIFQVGAGQVGLVARFGALRESPTGTPVFQPGWYWSLPDPFDEKLRLPGPREVREIELDTFAFQPQPTDAGKTLSEAVPLSPGQLNPGTDGAMLTGDKNLSHARWRIQYTIEDAEVFERRVGFRNDVEYVKRGEDAVAQQYQVFERLMKRLAESAIARTVATKTIDEVLISEQAVVIREVEARLQEELDELQVGVEISRITAEITEPFPVRDAFRNLQVAESDRQKSIEQARGNAAQTLTSAVGDVVLCNRLLDLIDAYGRAQRLGAEEAELARLRAAIDAHLAQARGEVGVMIQEAQARAADFREQVGQEYDEFRYYLEQYNEKRQITTLRLWVQMLSQILGSKQNEIFTVAPDADEVEIVINRDPVRQIEAERERARQRMEAQRGGNRER